MVDKVTFLDIRGAIAPIDPILDQPLLQLECFLTNRFLFELKFQSSVIGENVSFLKIVLSKQEILFMLYKYLLLKKWLAHLFLYSFCLIPIHKRLGFGWLLTFFLFMQACNVFSYVSNPGKCETEWNLFYTVNIASSNAVNSNIEISGWIYAKSFFRFHANPLKLCLGVLCHRSACLWVTRFVSQVFAQWKFIIWIRRHLFCFMTFGGTQRFHFW